MVSRGVLGICSGGLEGIIEACPGGIYKSVPGGGTFAIIVISRVCG